MSTPSTDIDMQSQRQSDADVVGSGVLTRTVIISDLHIGAGALDDCDTELENQLVKFLDFLAADNEPLELVIAGDFLDFAQAPPAEAPNLHATSTEGLPLSFTEEQSLEKLESIAEQHPRVFRAIGRFIDAHKLHRCVILPGNHDVDFFWPRVRARFLELSDATASERLTFHLQQVYHPPHAPTLWIEHGHQYDACNRFFVGDRPFFSEENPPIFTDSTGTKRLLECIGTRFLTRFMNSIDKDYPFVDNVKPFSKFFRLFGASALVPGYGPIRAAIAVWAMARYLGRLALIDRSDVLNLDNGHPMESSALVADIASRMPDGGAQLVMALGTKGLHINRPLAMYAQTTANADRVLDLLASDLSILDEIDATLPILGSGPRGTLSLARGFHIDETQALISKATNIATSNNVDSIVMGHTHEPVDKSLRSGGAKYINIGSWTRYLRVLPGMEFHPWSMLRRGQEVNFPFSLRAAWHDPTLQPALSARTFTESANG